MTTRLRLRCGPEARGSVHDITMLYRLLLGREPESAQVIAEHRSRSLTETFTIFVSCPEFTGRVVAALQAGRPIGADLVPPHAATDQLQWLVDQAVLTTAQQQDLLSATSWNDVFGKLWSMGLREVAQGTVRAHPIEDMLIQFDRLCEEQAKGLPPLPNLIGVGAPRSGTTSLYYLLRSHPDIFMSHLKELNYFGRKSPAVRGPQLGISLDAYRMFFLGHARQPHIGEISPIYLSQPRAAQEIRAALGPKCKIIIQLRHPVDRFVSHFWHQHAQASSADLEQFTAQALDQLHAGRQDLGWQDPGTILRYSLYAEDIERYRQLFDPSNLLVLDYASFRKPVALAATLAAFLGVSAFAEAPGVENRTIPPSPVPAATRRRLQRFFAADIARTAAMTGLAMKY